MSGIVLKIMIMDTHPPVWRRVVVPEKMSFADLHCVIQEIFGWEDMHLHIFESPGNSFEIVKSKKERIKNEKKDSESVFCDIDRYHGDPDRM